MTSGGGLPRTEDRGSKPREGREKREQKEADYSFSPQQRRRRQERPFIPLSLSPFPLFTCGRRPAGHVMMSVVGVVGVVVVVVVGGEQLLYMGSPRAHVWS